jgi:signal transduction histidine kinase
LKFFSFSKKAVYVPLLVMTIVGLMFVNETSSRNSSALMEDMQEAQITRGAMHQLIQTILAAETSQRGYLLTGDERYLEPYTAALTQVSRQLGELQKIFTPHQDRLADFGIMSQHISRKLAEMDLTVRMRRENKQDAWQFVLMTDVGKELMEQVREKSTKLVATSTHDMAQLHQQINQTLLLRRIGIFVLAVLGLLGFYMYLVQSKALLNSVFHEQESLRHERDQLDVLVQQRTNSLAKLATHLQNVRENERAHLARELHDELGALFTAAKLDIARLKSRLGPTQPEAMERLAHLTATLNSGIALKRQIVEDLHPSALSHLGLVASLEILAREFEKSSDLSITTNLQAVDLGGSAALTVYRLVQESLTNIGKHAEATKIVISLQATDGHATVEVFDNGKGFDANLDYPNSHGLSGMRHRVESAGGRFSVTTSPQAGTKISAALPKDH